MLPSGVLLCRPLEVLMLDALKMIDDCFAMICRVCSLSG